jgi:hypothetical protein
MAIVVLYSWLSYLLFLLQYLQILIWLPVVFLLCFLYVVSTLCAMNCGCMTGMTKGYVL